MDNPRHCLGTSDRVCNHFFPARDNDPHLLCISYRSKECNIDDRCWDCHDWDDDVWQKVSATFQSCYPT